MDVRGLEGPDDLRGAIRSHARAWHAAYSDLLPDDAVDRIATEPTDEAVQEWAEQIRGHRDGFLVAVEDGVVRGYAYFRWGDDTKEFVGPDGGGLKEIYVDPDYWGRGVGTRLLERGIELLPGEVETLALEVFAANDRGRRFYEARGFEPVDEDEVEIAGEPYPTVIYAREVDRSGSG